MDQSCPDCDKPLALAKQVIKCSACMQIFCEKHSKYDSKNQIICRKCFLKLLKKKILKEYSEDPLALARELRSIKANKLSSKQKIEKKQTSIKSLQCKLSFIKVCHKDSMKTLNEQLFLSISSNTSLQLVANSMTKAKNELQECLKLKSSELENTETLMNKLFYEKSSLELEMMRIGKICENLRNHTNLSIPYTKIKCFCCSRCIKIIKNQFKKHATASVKSRTSSCDKSSVKSLPSYPSDSCKCNLF